MPVIVGWSVQRYANVPAVSNVYEYVPPRESVSLAGPPLLPVTVWLTLSLFVQVTVVPAVTVSVAGENADPLMLTDRATAAFVFVVDAVFVLETAVFESITAAFVFATARFVFTVTDVFVFTVAVLVFTVAVFVFVAVFE